MSLTPQPNADLLAYLKSGKSISPYELREKVNLFRGTYGFSKLLDLWPELPEATRMVTFEACSGSEVVGHAPKIKRVVSDVRNSSSVLASIAKRLCIIRAPVFEDTLRFIRDRVDDHTANEIDVCLSEIRQAQFENERAQEDTVKPNNIFVTEVIGDVWSLAVGPGASSQTFVAKGDMKSLEAYLRRLRVPTKDLEELKNLLAQNSDTDTAQQKIPKRVTDWIKRTTKKLSGGASEVVPGIIANLISRGVLMYFGIDPASGFQIPHL